MKRRTFTLKEKLSAVKDRQAGAPIAEVMKKYRIKSPSQLANWQNGKGLGKLPVSKPPKSKGNGHSQKPDPTNEAVNYLRHAEAEISKRLSSGNIEELDAQSLYTVLALRALEGQGRGI